ncbi:MAG: proline dehydrogenase family protein [Fuerstiella sp.]
MAKKVSIDDRVESRTQEIGEELLGRLEHRSPSLFHGQWWEDRLMNWAMADEAVKVQLFRFIDVLPMLRDHQAISRHLDEYFEHVKDRLPWAARLGLNLSTGNSILSRALAFNARSNADRMARRFIVGESGPQILQSVQDLRRKGCAFSLDYIGGAVLSDVAADLYQTTYVDVIDQLAEATSNWGDVALLDHGLDGALPRLNLSINLTSLDSQFSCVDPVGTTKRVLQRLRPLLRKAQEHDAHIHFDPGHTESRLLIRSIFQQVLMEEEFRNFADVGIAVPAYYQDSDKDLKQLLAWVKKRKTPVSVTLVKGRHWDTESVTADYQGWPCPVYRRKWQSDDRFESGARMLMKNHALLRPALASHNVRSLAAGLAWAEEYKVPDHAFEVQMLYGMGNEKAQLFSERGHRVRVHSPFGKLIPGIASLVRGHLENTSNDSYLRHSFSERVATKTLLMKPSENAAKEPPVEDKVLDGFVNESRTDFSLEENRTVMKAAIDAARDEIGQTWPLVVDGKSSESRTTLTSRNPSNATEVLGYVAAASQDQAGDAVEAARRTFPQWASMETQNRCEYLELIAAEMRERRFELAAWIILEVGKPWKDADAEVAEAIDFCMYYASEMRRLDQPVTNDFAGEANSYSYRPRGVAVVIAPWNFPLAVLAGMTGAALVTGNTVVMKPAEQSSIVAAKLMEMIRNAGVPDGVVNFLPGIGDDVGPTLVGSPDVDMVCFTGSQEVGLEIFRTASETDHRQINVRRVIAEMGGKNAIIVDEDADLDEAVAGVVSSAFGYAGQKCSSCSRVIVLEKIYDEFLEHLVQATQSLIVGPAEDPATTVGPVIDDDARQQIVGAIKSIDAEEGEELALQVDVKKLGKDGTFIGPAILTGIAASSNLAQEEFFGPLLSVMKVRNLDDAFAVANDSKFALTGGMYSRSPVNLKRARNEFEVGNLYLNREITGSLVQRQPFGGYRMSGVGTKSGGPDYLQQFLVPVNVTENTMRDGFAKDPNAKQDA